MADILQVFTYQIDLRLEFRGITTRQGMLLRGPAGWAKWSPFTEYDDQTAADWLRAAIEVATAGYPDPVRSEIPINAIIPLLPPDQVGARAQAADCQTAKIKLSGSDLATDEARVAALRNALGPQGKIRLDLNGAWQVSQALAALEVLSPYGLEYVEQPCPEVTQLAELRHELIRRGIPSPIAADESIRLARDPLQVKKLAAADVAILKVQPLGGIKAALRLAQQIELPVVVSSALETSLGLRAGLALAAALPEPPLACGLETASLFTADVTAAPLLPRHGVMTNRDVAVDERRLSQVTAPNEVKQWWLARLTRVAALLGIQPDWEVL